MISTPDVQANIATAGALVRQAAAGGARFIALPEYWPIMGMSDTDKVALAEQPGQGPIQDFMARAAREHGVWLVGGTLPLISHEPGKVMNTTLVYDPQGKPVGRYDKIHLFGFSKGGESYDEARTIVPGRAITVLETSFGRVGIAVCYDLRFPELFRAMGECTLMVVTAAFTHTTGMAHWEVLLRARAIENQCYMLASAQGGVHANGRRTFGHSMLIDPWGEIKAVVPDGLGIASGSIDAAFLANVRENLPALKHRRL